MKISKSDKITQFDPEGCPYPFEDDDAMHYFITENGHISAALALCTISPEEFEVYAYTIREKRRNGYFSALYRAMTDDLQGAISDTAQDIRLTFVVPHPCTEAEPILKKLGASFDSTEITMRKELTDADLEGYCRISEDNIVHYEILSYSDGTAYLHSFEVHKDLRGLGVGSRAFGDILAQLYKKGFKSILLQVSEANIPAVRIYKSYGLKEVNAVSYYSFTVNNPD